MRINKVIEKNLHKLTKALIFNFIQNGVQKWAIPEKIQTGCWGGGGGGEGCQWVGRI